MPENTQTPLRVEPIVLPRFIKLALAEHVLRHCGCSTNEAELAHFIKKPSHDIVNRCRGGKAVKSRVTDVVNQLIAQCVGRTLGLTGAARKPRQTIDFRK